MKNPTNGDTRTNFDTSRCKPKAEPIPLNEVTVEQVFKAYEDNSIVADMWTWAAVLESEPMYLALKRQASMQPIMKQKQERVQQAPKQEEKCLGIVEGPIQLSKIDVIKLRSALSLCRNTLQSSAPSNFSITEAVAEIYHVKKIIDNKLIKAQRKRESR